MAVCNSINVSWERVHGFHWYSNFSCSFNCIKPNKRIWKKRTFIKSLRSTLFAWKTLKTILPPLLYSVGIWSMAIDLRRKINALLNHPVIKIHQINDSFNLIDDSYRKWFTCRVAMTEPNISALHFDGIFHEK